MVTKAQRAAKTERALFLKSLTGHAVGVAIAILGFYQDNPALGWGGAVIGILGPVYRNWLDTQNRNYGRTK